MTQCCTHGYWNINEELYNINQTLGTLNGNVEANSKPIAQGSHMQKATMKKLLETWHQVPTNSKVGSEESAEWEEQSPSRQHPTLNNAEGLAHNEAPSDCTQSGRMCASGS